MELGLKTRVTEMYGIRYPVICGGMLWVAVPELCAAISNAGGLGCITAANYNSGEELREAIKKVKELTNKPFGVNITLLPSFRITEQMYDDYFRVCCEEKVANIEIAGNYAVKYMDMVHKAGVKIAHKVGAVRHALAAEKHGYDAIFAAGIEEGGHPLSDDVTTMVLTARIAESVKIPVISTGGIVDGRSLAAALCLGAEGVMMATRFIATDECPVHPDVKTEILKRQETDTTLICKTLGLQARALKNDIVSAVLEIEARNGGIEELKDLISGERLRKGIQTGNVNDFVLQVGQSTGLVKEIKTCKQVIEDMVGEAKAILEEKQLLFK